MKSIEHFDPKKNVRFATYAVWWIRAYITRYLKDNRSQVRGGESERQSMVDFSLDVAIDDDAETTYLERLEDPNPGPQADFISSEKDEDVQEALARVRKRIGDLGWAIVQERLTQDKPRTLEETFLARYLSAFNQDQEAAVADAA
jgi:RNA polymerase primary sigma factor